MVEPIMYFAIGFLVSTLLGLAIVPLVHNRAVRLTTKRLEAATPLSMAEIQADKDQLRAEFAMSARRLEMSVDQLKHKTTSQLAELGKKSDSINRLKFELGEKNAAIFSLEAREKAIREQLRATEEEFTSKTQLLRQAETDLSDKRGELAKLEHQLSERSLVAESRQAELATVTAQIAALQQRVGEAEQALALTRQNLEAQRGESQTATSDLNAARETVNGLGQRVADLEKQLIAQTKEAELLGSRANDLENRLAVQGKMLAERGFENHQLRQQLEAAQASMSGSGAVESLRAEKATLEQQLAIARDERAKMQRELNAIQQQAESSWASERMENAVLRERINDIAAEVARLAMTLEGPESPIEKILATEAAGTTPALAPTEPANANTSQLAPSPISVSAPRLAEAPLNGGAQPRGTLADRIRALQAQASRTRQVS
jgi:DNA repair exonuclease SbcCD ATPase subunit